MDDDTRLSLKLATIAFNIKSKMFGVLDSFLSLLKTYEEKKTHNFLSFMLNPKFKNLCLIFSYVKQEQKYIYCGAV
jgi:hypothetical protein